MSRDQQDSRKPLLSVDADYAENYDAVRMGTVTDEKSEAVENEAGSGPPTIHLHDDMKHENPLPDGIHCLSFDKIVEMWDTSGLPKGKLPEEIPNTIRFKHIVHKGGDVFVSNFPKKQKEAKLPKKKAEDNSHLMAPSPHHPHKQDSSMPSEEETIVFEALKTMKVKSIGSVATHEGEIKKMHEKAKKIAPKYEDWLHKTKHMVFQVPDARRILFLDAKIKRLSQINTAEESFEAVFHFYLTYLATEKEANAFTLKKLLGKEEDFEPEWDPLKKLNFTNKIDGEAPDMDGSFGMKPGYEYVAPNALFKDKDGKEVDPFTCKDANSRVASKKGKPGKMSFDISTKKLGFDPRYGYWLRVKYDCQMTFAEEFELFAFPFDTQDLTIEIGCEPGTAQCDILPFPRLGDFVMLDPRFSLVSEWELNSILVESGVSPIPSKSGKKRQRMSIHVKASRRWMASLSYWIVTFCMFGLSLATFAMEPIDDLGDRLGFGITFLLADVATLQLLEEKTPAIPYWTLLDYYMYSCFVFLCIIISWTALAGGIGTAIPDSVDVVAAWVAVAVFVMFHIAFTLMAMAVHRDEEQKIEMTESQLEVHFKKQDCWDSVCCCECCRGACKTVLNNPTLETKWNCEEMIGDKESENTLVMAKGNKVDYDEADRGQVGQTVLP